jgi:hypothetical protein
MHVNRLYNMLWCPTNTRSKISTRWALRASLRHFFYLSLVFTYAVGTTFLAKRCKEMTWLGRRHYEATVIREQINMFYLHSSDIFYKKISSCPAHCIAQLAKSGKVLEQHKNLLL